MQELFPELIGPENNRHSGRETTLCTQIVCFRIINLSVSKIVWAQTYKRTGMFILDSPVHFTQLLCITSIALCLIL